MPFLQTGHHVSAIVLVADKGLVVLIVLIVQINHVGTGEDKILLLLHILPLATFLVLDFVGRLETRTNWLELALAARIFGGRTLSHSGTLYIDDMFYVFCDVLLHRLPSCWSAVAERVQLPHELGWRHSILGNLRFLLLLSVAFPHFLRLC